jgi:hypothetical protein
MKMFAIAIAFIVGLAAGYQPIQLINLFSKDNGALYNEFAVLVFRIYA